MKKILNSENKRKKLRLAEFIKLEEKLNIVKKERDEAKADLHVIMIHCCKLIAKYECRSFEKVYKQINNSLQKIKCS